jgi:8-oxo-dGTP pyrophosphatase MutT (NUDIX family)
MELDFVLSKVNRALQNGLPGDDAHSKLSPSHRKPASEYLAEVENYKTGCVVALITKNSNDESCLILMERVSHEKDVHSSQISFPGGKHEEEDESFYATAIRELEEEIGVTSSEINFISPLSELYIPPSNFLVKPFLCYSTSRLEYRPNQTEVKSLLEVPLAFFINDENINRGGFQSARGYFVNAPYYEFQSHKIWGATAMMIAEIVALINSEID